MNEITIKYEIENDVLFLNVEVIKDGEKIEIDQKKEEEAAAFILYSENRRDINRLAYLNIKAND